MCARLSCSLHSSNLRAFSMKRLVAAAALALAWHGAPVLAQGTGNREVEEAVVRSVRGRSATADVVLLEESVEAQSGVWVAFAVRRPGGRLAPTLHACAATLTVPVTVQCALLPTPGAVARDEEEPFAADSLAYDDIDDDGEAEARIIVNFQTATADVDRMFIVDLVPRPRIAFQVETRRNTETPTVTAVRRPVMFTDANGDRHNDAVVEETMCREAGTADRCSPVRRTIYMWNPRTDLWVQFRAR